MNGCGWRVERWVLRVECVRDVVRALEVRVGVCRTLVALLEVLRRGLVRRGGAGHTPEDFI